MNISRVKPVSLAAKWRFLQPTVLVVACYFIAMTIIFGIAGPQRSGSDQVIQQVSSNLDALIQPSPALSVTEVVQIQLDGLSNTNQAEGILQCMTFASPGNRTVTGPLARFGRMVRSEEFSPLEHPDRVIIGKPMFENEIARILVSVVADRQLRSYIWLLSQQDEPPYENCWMTDSVFAVESPVDDEPPKALEEIH